MISGKAVYRTAVSPPAPESQWCALRRRWQAGDTHVPAEGTAGGIRARLRVQFCVQFVPDQSVPSAVKVLVEVPGTTRVNSCGLGADIF